MEETTRALARRPALRNPAPVARTPHPFAQLRAAMLHAATRPGMLPGDVALYVALALHAHEGRAWPSQETLGRYTATRSDTTVRAGLRRLTAAGLVRPSRRTDGRARSRTALEYRLVPVPHGPVWPSPDAPAVGDQLALEFPPPDLEWGPTLEVSADLEAAGDPAVTDPLVDPQPLPAVAPSPRPVAPAADPQRPVVRPAAVAGTRPAAVADDGSPSGRSRRETTQGSGAREREAAPPRHAAPPIAPRYALPPERRPRAAARTAIVATRPTALPVPDRAAILAQLRAARAQLAQLRATPDADHEIVALHAANVRLHERRSGEG